MRELIIDNFAGGGGTSTGIEAATGRPVDVAINHDPAAIAMHAANHPKTYHYCENIWDVKPFEVTKGRPVALAWFSPDCTHFSAARGGIPVKKEIRGLAWVAVRWAAAVRPRVIILENVREFTGWGPVKDGKPVKELAGTTFKNFIGALSRRGYEVDWRELRACDYGAPTIRKRLFIIARCDGLPIVWPEPTHGAPDIEAVISGQLLPWRTAAEIIDWSIPCPSIFDSADEIWRKYGARAIRPLADATLRRIARGVKKFVDNSTPYIIPWVVTRTENAVGAHVYKPINTIRTGGGGGQMLVEPILTQYHGDKASDKPRGQNVELPLATVDTANRYALVTSHLCVLRNHMDGQPLSEPMLTIESSGGHFGEVRAFLTKYYGHGDGQSLADPLHTITSKDRLGLVTVHGEQYAITDIGMRMLTPRELFNAQGFPPDYIIDVDIDGKPMSKSAQVARCGNAVPPPFAEALVRANLPELCGGMPEEARGVMA